MNSPALAGSLVQIDFPAAKVLRIAMTDGPVTPVPLYSTVNGSQPTGAHPALRHTEVNLVSNYFGVVVQCFFSGRSSALDKRLSKRVDYPLGNSSHRKDRSPVAT